MADNMPQQKEDALPNNLVKIGTVRTGEEPRTVTFLSRTVQVGGYFASFFGGFFSQEVVSELFKENTAAHQLAEGDGFLKGFQAGINRAVDLKLWKSNVATWATALGGIFLTDWVVKKIEQRTFHSRHGTFPRTDQVSQILEGKSEPIQNSETVVNTNWQDTTKKSEESQRSVGV